MNWDEAHLLGDLEAQETRMSDDLVKLLRRPYGNLTFAEKEEVADRIEELEAKLSKCEALLAKALEMLRALGVADAILAELTGGKDDQ